MAINFGFGDPYDDFPLPVSGSSVNSLPPEQWTTGTLAQTAFGQGEVQTNAFEMALVAGAVANDGELMEPRIVREVRSPDGIILDNPTPSVRRQALPQSTASTLNEMMQEVVIQGVYRGPDRRHEGRREDGNRRVRQRAPALVVDHLRPSRRPEDRYVRDDREWRKGR